MLTLLLGKDWTENRREILRRVAQDVKEERPGRILLVPELISHDTERRLAGEAGDTASRFAQVLSFTRLARRISEIVGSAAEECLDNGGRLVAMASAARQLHSRLKVYAAVETRPEFLTELVEAMDEFKRCCISSADLQEASEKATGSFSEKLRELSQLMAAYDGLCQHGKRDPRDQMQWVLEKLSDIDFAENHVFYVEGFPDFTRQHLNILDYLIKASPSVTVCLNCDKVNTDDLAFEKAAATARELIQCAARAGVEYQILPVPENPGPLNLVRQRLFQGSTATEPGLKDRLTLIRSDSAFGECQAVAADIFQKIRSGDRYRDIALVCPDMKRYGSILRLVFKKWGIPLYLSGTEDIMESGVISTVVYALDAALNHFDQKDMLRYLRSPMSPLSQDTCDLVENHVIIWRISGKMWSEPWTQHPDGLSAEWNDQTRARLAELECARQQIMEPLQSLRRSFQEAVCLRQQVTGLYCFLEDTAFARRLLMFADELESEGDFRGAQILNQLWEILLTALEQLHDVLGDTYWENEHFSRLLRLLLSQYDVGTIPPVLDAVMVGPVSAMRCQQQKHLYVLGAGEGALPGYGGSSGLLTDQEREELRRLDVPLTGGAADGLQAEFAEIYGVFCGAEETVTLTCSDAQPSYIYRRLASLAGGENGEKAIPGNVPVSSKSVAAFLASQNAEAAADDLGIREEYTAAQQKRLYRLGNIRQENVPALYGKRLQLSASQVDQFALCRMAYFLKYGLRIKERKEAEVDPAEFGTYVHAVLEKTGRDIMELGGFGQVDLEQTRRIALEHSQVYAREHFGQLVSSRMEYLFRRNVEELELVVEELWRELSQAKYAPMAFELQFSSDGEMPDIAIDGGQMPASLRGFVDRVDHWQHGNSHYFRVVDYKTGKKDFDYCDVFNGVGLQMLLYLFALEDGGRELLGENRVSAGIQYFPARVPFISVEGAMTAEEAAAQRRKDWKRPGLVLDDSDSVAAMDPSEDLHLLNCALDKSGCLAGDIASRQQLGILKTFVMNLLRKMVNQVAQGDTLANPYTRGTSYNACTFCPYGNICHKESVTDRRNYKMIKAQQFWENVTEEVEHHG